jgi:hypothetical protein
MKSSPVTEGCVMYSSQMEAESPFFDVTTITSPTHSLSPENARAVLITLVDTTCALLSYRIDGQYLDRWHVGPEGTDPFDLTVSTIKHLIAMDWRDRMLPSQMHATSFPRSPCPGESPPPSSSSDIRLVHFGRNLNDRSLLKGTYESTLFLT